MPTKIFKSTRPDDLKITAEIIKQGGTVAFPTETVYGLGANALDPQATAKIYLAKGRPSWNPLIVHVSSLEMLKTLVRELPADFQKLSTAFWPGPLTMLLPKSDKVPAEVSAGRDLVALRMPKHPIALKLIELSGLPIAAPSANRSGHTSPTTAQHVLDDLDGRIDAIIDGGPCDVGVESTVLDITQNPPMILRPGGITKEQIEKVLGREVVVFKKSAEGTAKEKLPSPGMTERHYAPKAQLINVEGALSVFQNEVARQVKAGKKVGVLLPNDWILDQAVCQLDKIICFDYGKWGDWEQQARLVFGGLRWLDKQGVDVILSPLPSEQGLGLALRDRLGRAAK